ncbi:ABC-2 type transport system permease protein [Tamaricihabitans halophyticus]|uniref:ABC-2 type transport system permease protein n=1 Tax=Tamaricihabitans halophyticus TaxID=1262583 RepID=A0A4R2QHI4_9PSEU|nr:ABC transporter permease [Tamaricihabitans halophyticus]TCP48627.1 ABC-2 type transport system permease protein [Tamaricihabitans halophyticus]
MSTMTMSRPAAQAPGRQNSLAGTGTLIRFMLRRDRVRIPVWLIVFALVPIGTLSSFAEAYPSAADRMATAQSMNSPAALAMLGPAHYFADYNSGSMLMHQLFAFTAMAVGLMSVLLVVRHTRTEEETGRAELVRATVVGRHANTAAALIVAFATNVVLGLLIAASTATSDMDGITTSGALLFGAAHTAVGIVFAALAAVTVQITGYSRGASGMALAGIGVAYVLRAAGDVGENGLSWVSPIGWGQRTWVFVDGRWWPLLLSVALTVVLTVLAVILSTRRDVGSGLRQARPGSPAASDLLVKPFGLALRLHRGMLIGFTVTVALLAVAYGSIFGDIDEMLGSVTALSDALAEQGGVLIEAFLSMVMLVTAVTVAIYAVLATNRMRAEELAGRAEPVLALPLSRTRWVGSHLAVTLLGSAVMQLIGGALLGYFAADATGDGALFGKSIAAAAAYLPALWCTIGLVVLLYGLRPQWIGLGWLVPVWAFGIGYLGNILGLPTWLAKLSPFGHVPEMPSEEFSLPPVLALTAIAVALIAIGLAGLKRRSINVV